MSIEDVEYLKTHSYKESYMFMVDSDTRDKKTYLTPAEYKVQFSSPFKLVYSIDVLDASIPRTQYAVDIHNNKLCYKIYSNSIEYNSDVQLIKNAEIKRKNDELNLLKRKTYTENYNNIYDTAKRIQMLTVNNGDSSITYDNLSEYLNAVYPIESNAPNDWRNYYNMNYESKLMQVGDYTDTVYISKFNELMSPLFMENLSNPGNILSTFVILSENPFIIDTKESTMNTVLGFNMYADPNETEKYQYIDTQVFGSVQKNDFKEFVALESPIPIGVTEQIGVDGDDTSNNDYTITINESGFLSEIRIAFEPSDELKTVQFDLIDNNTSIVNGRIILNENQMNGFAYIRNGLDYVLLDSSYVISQANTERVYINSGDYTLRLYRAQNSQSEEINVNIQKSNTQPVVGINVIKHMYKIEAPGMYSLLGDRYVMLKCREIEEHMYRSRSFEKYNMGIAKFKLSVVGYDESRFDFATIPPREFHPIGKLTSMTFRFERPDGSLYNFRGVNHTLTLALRYYVPNKSEEFTNYELNPEYEPDFFKYQQRDPPDTDSDED